MLLKSSRRRTLHRVPSFSPTALGMAAIPLLVAAFAPVLHAQTPPAQPSLSALEAVTLMARHEIADHRGAMANHAFRFLSIERSARTGGHLWTEEVVEVDGGLLRRLLAVDGKTLSPAGQAEEDHRLQQLVQNPSVFTQANHSRHKDEAHAIHVLQRMPKEFLFQYQGEENGCERIAYRPNPDYRPISFEDRAIHDMAGLVEIQQSSMRLCSITGHLVKTVDYGWGLLGHLTQGSGFTLDRSQVEHSVWRSTLLKVHFDGSIFFFKTISRRQNTVRSNFQPIPLHISLKQAVALSLPSAKP